MEKNELRINIRVENREEELLTQATAHSWESAEEQFGKMQKFVEENMKCPNCGYCSGLLCDNCSWCGTAPIEEEKIKDND